ncbi:MAG: urease accessory protein UreD, partial [Litorivicinus sp.]
QPATAANRAAAATTQPNAFQPFGPDARAEWDARAECDARAETQVELEPGARFIGWETHCAGRPVMGEAFDHGRIDARLRVTRDQSPLLSDRMLLDPAQGWSASAAHRAYPIQSTLIATPVTDDDLARVRDLCGASLTAGVTCVDGLLIVRALAQDTERAMALMTRVWETLRPSVIGRAPCAPRIWNT